MEPIDGGDFALEFMVLLEDDCRPVLVVGVRLQGHIRLTSVSKCPDLEPGRLLVEGPVGLENKVVVARRVVGLETVDGPRVVDNSTKPMERLVNRIEIHNKTAIPSFQVFAIRSGSEETEFEQSIVPHKPTPRRVVFALEALR